MTLSGVELIFSNRSAKFDRNTITITDNNDTICKASGSVLKFDGFLKIYNNQNKDDDESILPAVSKGPINIEALLDEQRCTQHRQDTGS